MFTGMTLIVVFQPSVEIMQGGDVNFIDLERSDDLHMERLQKPSEE